MKRLLLAFILLACCYCSTAQALVMQPTPLTFANAATSATPLLDKIVATSIGPTFKTVAKGTGIVGMPIMSTIIAAAEGNVPAMVGNALTIPVYIYASPLAGTAASLAVGYLTQAEFDTEGAYNNHWLDNYPLLKGIVDSHFGVSAPASYDPATLENGSSIPCPSGFVGCDPSHALLVTDKSVGWSGGNSLAVTTQRLNDSPPIQQVGPSQICVTYGPPSVFTVGEETYYRYHIDYYTFTIVPAVSTSIPSTLPDDQKGPLNNTIKNAATSNPSVKEELNNLAKAHPELIPTPQPISQTDINNWSDVNNSTVNNTYIENLEEFNNLYPNDITIKTALEQAKADAAKEEADKAAEKYDPIASSGFTPPYNPGEFNIPARFTLFLNNVKSSPLFTFSNSFFTSLPGGGSPVYEIEAGQFGHHTIDLSQTMTGGLVVLKTVLLAVFGFLSIRTIIMKR